MRQVQHPSPVVAAPLSDVLSGRLLSSTVRFLPDRAFAFLYGRLHSRINRAPARLHTATARVRYFFAIFTTGFVIIIGVRVISRIGQLGIEGTFQVIIVRDLCSSKWPSTLYPSQDGHGVSQRRQQTGRSGMHVTPIMYFVSDSDSTAQYTEITRIHLLENITIRYLYENRRNPVNNSSAQCYTNKINRSRKIKQIGNSTIKTITAI